MNTFTISLAGIPVQITSIHDEIPLFLSDYFTERDPLVQISMEAEDIEAERIKSVQQNERENKTARYSDAYLESLAILRKITDTLINYDVLLFHSSAVVYHDKAYLFAAPSGTGKTTHILKWLRLLPGSYVLNGDKPLIRVSNQQILVCGTPWRGKEKLGINDIKPLEAICFIRQDKENSIHPLSAEEALIRLMNQSYIPDGKTLEIMQLIKKIATQTRLYQLSCNMEDEAAQLSIKTLIKDEI